MNKILTICALLIGLSAQSQTRDTIYQYDTNPVTKKENQLCKWVIITIDGRRKVVQKMFADFTIFFEKNGNMKVAKTYDVINRRKNEAKAVKLTEQ